MCSCFVNYNNTRLIKLNFICKFNISLDLMNKHFKHFITKNSNTPSKTSHDSIITQEIYNDIKYKIEYHILFTLNLLNISTVTL